MPAPLTDTEVRPKPACAHCGLPVPDAPPGEAPVFCCSGCAVVYNALHEAGYADTFYRLRQVSDAPACPAPVSTDPLGAAFLDDPSFLDAQAPARADGTRRVELFLDGVHCAACVWLVERLPFELDGVLEARLDLPRARVHLHWDPSRVRLSDVARRLSRLGYQAHPVSRQPGRTAAERRLLTRMGISWAIAGNVMLLAFAFYAGLDAREAPALTRAARWLSLALTLPAVVYGGAPFFQRAWTSLRQAVRRRSARHLHMDTPIALGILAGFGHSAWATFTGRGEVWFDSVTVLIAALLTARWLQLRSRRLAGEASERLLALVPPMARRKRADGSTETVRSDAIRAGDLVAVPAGEVFPADGRIVSGRSAMDQAILTGESRPVEIAPGGRVHAGATNLRAPVLVRVEAAGEETRVGRLLQWVRQAATERAPVVLLADRLAGYFVAGVLGLAGMTALIWIYGLHGAALPHVVALLVVTCPCALGMATPLSMAVATGRAARAGLFVKHEAAFETLTRVDTVVLDKTGTVTEGRLRLIRWSGAENALQRAAALEQWSNHPLALAFRQAVHTPYSAAEDSFSAVPGQGIHGLVEGSTVWVGRPEWIEAGTGATFDAFRETVERMVHEGLTPVGIAVDGEARAVAAFGDDLRPDAAESIDTLQRDGKRVFLLSGDHPSVVTKVAERLGIPAERALGGVTPEEKLQFVEELSGAGAVVAMVGDGVNDAAALQAAAVGIAVEGGTAASRVTADVFLTRKGLAPVLTLLRGSRSVMQVIHRTLAFSLGYNVLGAGAAMAGLVTPLLAALAMPLSSLTVVLMAITQRPFRPVPLSTRLSETTP